MKKVLILDDDEAILEALQIAVESAGYEVKTTLKAESLLKLCLDYKPAVVLSDLLLSGKDGRELLTQLRANSKTKKIPIIMLSAHPDGEAIAQACGADDFLAKPFDISELLHLIGKYAA